MWAGSREVTLNISDEVGLSSLTLFLIYPAEFLDAAVVLMDGRKRG